MHHSSIGKQPALAGLLAFLLLASAVPFVPQATAAEGDDSDGDGITDVDELQLGTNPEMKDTDEDGISDYDEINVWHTNPTRESTDGDRYDDGMEIFGHSPVGLGEFGGDMPGYVRWPGSNVFAAAFPDIEIEIEDEIHISLVQEIAVEYSLEKKNETSLELTTIDSQKTIRGSVETHTINDWQLTHNTNYDERIAKDYNVEIVEDDETYVQEILEGIEITTAEGDSISLDISNPNAQNYQDTSDEKIKQTPLISKYMYDIKGVDEELWQFILSEFYIQHGPMTMQDFLEQLKTEIEIWDIAFSVFLLIPSGGPAIKLALKVGDKTLSHTFQADKDKITNLQEKLDDLNYNPSIIYYEHNRGIINPFVLIGDDTFNPSNLDLYITQVWTNSIFDDNSEYKIEKLSELKELMESNPKIIDHISPDRYLESIGPEITDYSGQVQWQQDENNTIGATGSVNEIASTGNLPQEFSPTINDYDMNLGVVNNKRIFDYEEQRGVNKQSSFQTTEIITKDYTKVIVENQIQSITERWSTMMTNATEHVADLDFDYRIRNTGTDIARELRDLKFNIYLGEKRITHTEEPISNLIPGADIEITVRDVKLDVDELKWIDNGSPIRVVVEYYSFGEDQLYYESALGKCVLYQIDDGVTDGDNSINKYLIATWGTETYYEVLQRLVPVDIDDNLRLISIDGQPVTEWAYWSIKLTRYTDSKNFLFEIAKPRTRLLLTYYQDSDHDHFNDRTEMALGHDPFSTASHPSAKLVAGYVANRTGNNITLSLKLSNIGDYAAHGIMARSFSPDGSTQFTNNIIGGDGYLEPGAWTFIMNDTLDYTILNEGVLVNPIIIIEYNDPAGLHTFSTTLELTDKEEDIEDAHHLMLQAPQMNLKFASQVNPEMGAVIPLRYDNPTTKTIKNTSIEVRYYGDEGAIIGFDKLNNVTFHPGENTILLRMNLTKAQLTDQINGRIKIVTALLDWNRYLIDNSYAECLVVQEVVNQPTLVMSSNTWNITRENVDKELYKTFKLFNIGATTLEAYMELPDGISIHNIPMFAGNETKTVLVPPGGSHSFTLYIEDNPTDYIEKSVLLFTNDPENHLEVVPISGEIAQIEEETPVKNADLRILNSNIAFSKDAPLDQEVITINVTIENIDETNLTNVTVRFYEGEYTSYSSQIGEDVILEEIITGISENISISYTYHSPTHFIYVHVDPENHITESNENNNIAYALVNVTRNQAVTNVTNEDFVIIDQLNYDLTTEIALRDCATLFVRDSNLTIDKITIEDNSLFIAENSKIELIDFSANIDSDFYLINSDIVSNKSINVTANNITISTYSEVFVNGENGINRGDNGAIAKLTLISKNDMLIDNQSEIRCIGGNGKKGIDTNEHGGKGGNGGRSIITINSFNNISISESIINSKGGSGGSGGSGSANVEDYRGGDGGNGNSGLLYLNATNYISIVNSRLTTEGGLGGFGRDGRYIINRDGSHGGKGGLGGESLLKTSSTIFNVSNSSIKLVGGNGVRGGKGANGGSGGNHGGYGSDGGSGGDSYLTIITNEINLFSKTLIIQYGGESGKGGNGGSGKDGYDGGAPGKGNSGGISKSIISANVLIMNNSNIASYGGKGGEGGHGGHGAIDPRGCGFDGGDAGDGSFSEVNIKVIEKIDITHSNISSYGGFGGIGGNAGDGNLGEDGGDGGKGGDGKILIDGNITVIIQSQFTSNGGNGNIGGWAGKRDDTGQPLGLGGQGGNGGGGNLYIKGTEGITILKSKLLNLIGHFGNGGMDYDYTSDDRRDGVNGTIGTHSFISTFLYSEDSTIQPYLKFDKNASLVNFTSDSEPLPQGDAVFQVHYWLTVNVDNEDGYPVEGATASISRLNSTTTPEALTTDANGRAIIHLIGSYLTSTTTTEAEPYIANASYAIGEQTKYSQDMQIKLMNNIQVNLIIEQIYPDFKIDFLDIYLHNDSLAGTYLSTEVSIQNTRSSASNLEVDIYDGNPAVDGERIGQPILIDYFGNNKTIVIDTMGLLEYDCDSVYVVLDSSNAIPESDENNNIAFVAADLFVQSVDYDNQNPNIEGEQVPIEASIENLGMLNASSFMVSLIDETGRELDHKAVTKSLGEGNINVTLSLDTSGYLGPVNLSVIIDYHDDVEEMDEQNNVGQLTIVVSPKPEIAPISISSQPSVLLHNTTGLLQATIFNKDYEDGAYNVSFYNGQPEAGGRLIGTDTVVNPEKDGISIAEVNWSAPMGNYLLYVTVDSEDVVDEYNEFNNGLWTRTWVAYRPDAAVTDVVVTDSTCTVGESNTITANISNIGDVDLEDLSVSLYTDTRLITTLIIPSLLASDSKVISIDWNVEETSYMMVTVDPHNEFLEASEHNNEGIVSLQVFSKADLIPVGVYLSSETPVQGETLGISAIIENRGDTAAGAFRYRLQVDDFILEESTMSSLSEYQNRSIGSEWVSQSGWHTIRLAINLDGDIDESNVTNNIITKDIFVQKLSSERPVADAGDDIAVFVGTNVTLTGFCYVPDGIIVLYEWDFDGDGRYDWSSNSSGFAFHTYPESGMYMAILRVTNDDAATTTDSLTVTVREKPHLSDLVITSSTSPSEGDWVLFQASFANTGESAVQDVDLLLFIDNRLEGQRHYNAVVPGQKGSLWLSWQAVGGQHAILAQLVSSMTQVRIDNETAALALEVTPGPNLPPSPNALRSVTGYVGEKLILTAEPIDSDGTVEMYEWDFEGDGFYEWTSSDTATVVHIYGQSGIYYASFKAIDDRGAAGVATTLVVIEADTVPPVAFAGLDISIKVGECASFDGSLSHDNIAVTGYSWRFIYGEEEVNIEGAAASFTFESAGDYTVTLHVTDTAGNIGTDILEVHVAAKEKSGGDEGGGIPASSLTATLAAVTAAAIVLRRRTGQATVTRVPSRRSPSRRRTDE